jgi:hypothetical protein
MRRFVRCCFLVIFFLSCVPQLHAVRRIQGKTLRIRRRSFDVLGIFLRYPMLCGGCNKNTSERPLAIQNDIANKNDLMRIENNDDIWDLLAEGFLVRIPDGTASFYIDPRLEDEFRYASPAVLNYIEKLSSAYAKQFPGARLQVTSLVRSDERQRLLATKWIDKKRRIRNPKYSANAVLCDAQGGQHCSIHNTAYAFDLSKRRLPKKQVLWLTDFLANDPGVIAIYEPRGGNIHIMVIPQTTSGSVPPHTEPFLFHP